MYVDSLAQGLRRLVLPVDLDDTFCFICDPWGGAAPTGGVADGSPIHCTQGISVARS
jgi:hypothetical protein